jgi:MFS family permease
MKPQRDQVDAALASAMRKISRRLVWILGLAMLVAMMDRTNLSFAALTMAPALGLSSSALGLGAGLFFAAYLVAEVPSNVILAKVGARLWIARIMVTWGLISCAMAFIQSVPQFYALRFLLGMAEAGFVPGVLLYLTYWAPEQYRGRLNAYFLLAIPIAGVVTALISGVLLKLHGMWGLAGWQLVFLIEALPALVLGVFIYFYLDDRPADARWLNDAEKSALTSALARDRADASNGAELSAVLPALFKSPRFLIVIAGYFCLTIAMSTLTWTPQILQALDLPVVKIAFLSALPSAIAVAVMALVARSSDLHKERRGHYAFIAVCGGVGFSLIAAPGGGLWLKMVGLTLANAGAFGAMSVFWTIAATAMTPAQRPVGIALVSLLGVSAGMVSPIVAGYLRDITGGYEAAVAMGAAGAFVSAILLSFGAGEAKLHDSEDGIIPLEERL